MRMQKLMFKAGLTMIPVVGVTLVAWQMAAHEPIAQGQTPAATAQGSSAVAPAPVEVVRPERRALTRVLRMPATLLPHDSADLMAKTSGYIAEVVVDLGSSVRKGDVLLTIDVPEMADELRQARAMLAAKHAMARAFEAKVVQAQSEVATAEAGLTRSEAQIGLARVTLGRQEALWKENAVSDQAVDEVRNQFEIAEAQHQIAHAEGDNARAEVAVMEAELAVARAEVAVEEAAIARLKTLMSFATLTAPFDGIITERLVDPGAFVRSAADGASTPLLTIAHMDTLRLSLQIPESDAPFVQVGSPVKITVKALGDDTIRGTVARTALALRAETRTMRAEVDLDNHDGRMAAGMYAQVTVTLQTKQQALMIPAKAIRVRGRVVSVLVAEGGVARSREIKIGYDDGISAEILEGLDGREDIIVSGSSAVGPGSPVLVVAVGS